MMTYAKPGYRFYSVSTPVFFREYELPEHGKLAGDDLANEIELQELAEIHGAPIISSSYRLG